MPPVKPPGFFNREAAMGGVAVFALMLGSPVAIPLALAGAAVGAVLGRVRMQEESKNGILVKPPSFWNWGLAVGVVAGFLALPVMIPTLGLMGTGIGALFGASEAVAAAAMFLAPLITYGTTILMGGKAVERQMGARYVAARSTGQPVPETIPPGPLDIPRDAPEIPAPSEPKRGVPRDAPSPPPPDYGNDPQKLRSFLDEEMQRRALNKTQYPFNSR